MVGALTARSASQGDPPSSYRITRSVLMYRLVSRWQKKRSASQDHTSTVLMRSSSQRGRRDDTIVISQTILPSDM